MSSIQSLARNVLAGIAYDEAEMRDTLRNVEPAVSPETLANVLANHGSMSEGELASLAVSFPGLKVGVKMGCSLRFACPASEAAAAIALRCASNPNDYVREAFICSGDYDALCKVLGIVNSY